MFLLLSSHLCLCCEPHTSAVWIQTHLKTRNSCFFSEPPCHWPQTSRKQTSVGSISLPNAKLLEHPQKCHASQVRAPDSQLRSLTEEQQQTLQQGLSLHATAGRKPKGSAGSTPAVPWRAWHARAELWFFCFRLYQREHRDLQNTIRSSNKNENTQHAAIFHLLTVSSGVLLPIWLKTSIRVIKDINIQV